MRETTSPEYGTLPGLTPDQTVFGRAATGFVSAALFFLVSSPAFANPNETCRDLRKPREAVAACGALIAGNPKNAAFYVARGFAHLKNNDAGAALKDAQSALDINARDGSAYRLRGKALQMNRDVAGAQAAFEEAAKLLPRDPQSHADLGELFFLYGVAGQAVEHYERAIKLDPRNPALYVSRAQARLRSEVDFSGAAADINRALQINPKFSPAYTARAWLKLFTSKPDEALLDVEQALKLKPDEAGAYEARAHIHFSSGRRSEARSDAEKAVAIDESLELSVRLLDTLDASEPVTFKGECKSGGPRNIEAAYQSLKIEMQGTPKVGEPLKFAWSLPAYKRAPERNAYLVIAAPDGVRFDGKGFYALTGGARGPYGIQFGAGQSRAVAPLHTKFSEQSGEIEILPSVAGFNQFEWAIVGVDGCGEWIAGRGKSAPVFVTAGSPEIVVRNQFSAAQPVSVTRALRGTFEVHAYKDSYEVVDTASNSIVVRRVGRTPEFSPTGRFLIVSTPEQEVYEVIDLVANRAVGRYVASAFYWSHADSLLYIDSARNGAMHIVRTLSGKRYDPKSVMMLEGETWLEEKRKPVDIDPGNGAASFVSGSEAWGLEVSLERGVVAFLNAWNTYIDRNSIGGTTDINVADNEEEEKLLKENNVHLGVIADLGMRHEMLTYPRRSDMKNALTKEFGGELQISSWNTRDQLNFVKITERSREALEQMRATVLPTGQIIRVADRARIEVASNSPSVRRNLSAVNLTAGSARTAETVIGARLDHLQSRALKEIRSGRSAAEMQRIENEIKALYSPKIARFDTDLSNTYDTQPFPDPNAVPPEKPEEIRLVPAGRDLWRWVIGDQTFWLTQTVQTGRNAQVFQFSMLSAGKGSKPRHANLIDLAHQSIGKKGWVPYREGDPESNENEPQFGEFDLVELGDYRGELDAAFKEPSTVAISGNRYLAVMTRPVPRLLVFDLNEWKLVCAIANPPDGSNTTSLVVHNGARHVSQINADGSMRVYDCGSREAVLTGAYIDDELLLMDRNGYFEGSDDAAGYIELAIPGLPGRHLLSQFVDKLKRPGIAAEVLSGKKSPQVTITPPPTLRLASLDPAKGAMLEAYSPTGLRYVQLYGDGRVVKRVEGKDFALSLSLSREEIAPFRNLSAVAVDQSGIASAPVYLPPQARRSAAGRLFVLTVGIDDYPNLFKANLRYAASDAARIAKSAQVSPMYGAKMQPSVLRNAEASESAIKSALDKIVASAGPEDTILVSFAGHGVIDDRKRLRLALSSTSLDKLETTALLFDEVADRLKSARARVVLLLDVCHAGLSDQATVAANDNAVERLATSTGAGITVLSASKGRQFSLESDQIKGGRFSVAFERILTQERKQHDLDGDGMISLDELYRGLKAIVVRETGGAQTPWLSRNQVYGDIDLF